MHALPVLCGSCWVSESVSPRIDISVKEGDFFLFFFALFSVEVESVHKVVSVSGAQHRVSVTQKNILSTLL